MSLHTEPPEDFEEIESPEVPVLDPDTGDDVHIGGCSIVLMQLHFSHRITSYLLANPHLLYCIDTYTNSGLFYECLC